MTLIEAMPHSICVCSLQVYTAFLLCKPYLSCRPLACSHSILSVTRLQDQDAAGGRSEREGGLKNQ